MHRLLQRQIKKHFGSIDSLPSEWQGFLNDIDTAYCQYDDDHRIIERSLELSSEELLQANKQLQDLLKTVEGQVTERTAELTKANIELEETLINLKKAQVHIVQSEKMSSLGRLIAGVAHEINNPVNFIHGNLSYLKDYIAKILNFTKLTQKNYLQGIPEMEKLAEEIELEFIKQDLPQIINSMVVGTSRIQGIVQSLKNFSHMDEAEFKQVDIHKGIDNTLMILEHRLRSKSRSNHIQVIKQYGDLPLISCYAGQMNQVFVNILANAIDALEEVNYHPKIDLQGNPQEDNWARSPYIKIQTRVIDDCFVEIAIADNGNGIPEEFQRQIFDPFFTTKPVGKGTGMGMAISYQIITEKHNGKLTCHSTVGKGTEFYIHIPIDLDKFQ
ncbi:sensor histidine kinase [Pseudanabaena sp. 'Roaring Creek']|uniref:sensor histidine kinase n=1 Tax=Pseudanabaena sp. 'Roaring Creek' TaxID=1681830 RepID=UPI0006D842AB|nr:ATP-binding protein [Pseudanabaena sp. 'Roaring Creek']